MGTNSDINIPLPSSALVLFPQSDRELRRAECAVEFLGGVCLHIL